MSFKTKMFSIATSVVLALAMLIIGVWAVQQGTVQMGGSISFNATDVYARVSGSITGTESTVELADLYFSAEDENSPSDSAIRTWNNNSLVFAENSDTITINIEVENLAQNRVLNVSLEDHTSVPSSINKSITLTNGTTSSYTGGTIVPMAGSTGDGTSVISFAVSFTITDKNSSIDFAYDYILNLLDQSEDLPDVTVKYYNYDNSLLYTDTVEYGTASVYGGTTPTKPDEEPRYTYTFNNNWLLENDEESAVANLTSVVQDMDVYASFDQGNILYHYQIKDESGAVIWEDWLPYDSYVEWPEGYVPEDDDPYDGQIPVPDIDVDQTFTETTTGSSGSSGGSTGGSTINRPPTYVGGGFVGGGNTTIVVGGGSGTTIPEKKPVNSGGSGSTSPSDNPGINIPTQVKVLRQVTNTAGTVEWEQLYSGDKVYYDDILQITYTVSEGYTMSVFNIVGAVPTEIEGVSDTYIVQGDVTITYAETPISQTITFVTNNSAYGNPNKTTLEVPYGSKITIDEDVLIFTNSDKSQRAYLYALTTADTNTIEYTFDGFTLNGSALTNNYIVTDDITITLNFSQGTRYYSVRFYNYDGSLLYTATGIEYNTTGVDYNGPTPTRSSTGTYRYTFDGWYYNEQAIDLDSFVVDGNKNVYAQYTRTLREYHLLVKSASTTVQKDGQNVVELITTLHYGDVLTITYDVKEGYNQDLRVSGAVHTGTNEYTVTGNVSVALYESKITYTLRFNTSDSLAGSFSPTSLTVDWGTEYSVSGNTITVGDRTITLTHKTHAGYDFTFNGITVSNSQMSGTITSALTFTANYSRVAKVFDITIQSNNTDYGTVSQTLLEDIPYGTAITRSGNTITIGTHTITATATASTNQYKYAFSSWTTDSSVTGNMTITANFTRSARQYTVTIIVNNSAYGSVNRTSVSVPYGAEVSFNQNVATVGSYTITATPATGDSITTYAFGNWTYSGIVDGSITQNATITANFIMTLSEFEITSNNSALGSYQLAVDGNNVNVTISPNNSTFVGIVNNDTGEYTLVRISTSQITVTLPYERSGDYTIMFNSNANQEDVTINDITYRLYKDLNVTAITAYTNAQMASTYAPSPSSIAADLTVNENISYSSQAYEVVAVLDGAFANTTLGMIMLPNTVLYIADSAFSSSGVLGIGASETAIKNLNVDKTVLDLELDIAHSASGYGETIGTVLYIYLKNTSNVNEFVLNASGEESNGILKTFAILGLGSSTYDLSVSIETNMYGGGSISFGYPSIVESASIKVNDTSYYATPGGSKTDYSFADSYTHTWSKSYNDVVSVNDTIDIALWFDYSTTSQPCFVEGSLITLADGSTKPVEEITYDDLLLVWDFNRGTYSAAYPVWITRQLTTEKYYRITFNDGTVFENVVAHRLYSTDEDYFVKCVDALRSQVGHNFFAVDTDSNGQTQYDGDEILFTEKEMVSIEIVYETAYYYNLVTGYTMNVFVDSILTSCGMNNLYGTFTDETIVDGKVTSGMTYNLELMEERQNGTDTLYEYSELDVPQSFFYGYRLAEQKGVREIDDINQYVQNNIDTMRAIEQSSSGKNLWAVSTSDDDVLADDYVITKVEEGSTYTLPQPKVTTNFAGWYNVTDGKIYQAGEQVIIRMGTYFEAVYGDEEGGYTVTINWSIEGDYTLKDSYYNYNCHFEYSTDNGQTWNEIILRENDGWGNSIEAGTIYLYNVKQIRIRLSDEGSGDWSINGEIVGKETVSDPGHLNYNYKTSSNYILTSNATIEFYGEHWD